MSMSKYNHERYGLWVHMHLRSNTLLFLHFNTLAEVNNEGIPPQVHSGLKAQIADPTLVQLYAQKDWNVHSKFHLISAEPETNRKNKTMRYINL